MEHRRLRRLAALCQQAASVRTTGSGEADRVLMDLAVTLERRASAFESLLAGMPSPIAGSGLLAAGD